MFPIAQIQVFFFSGAFAPIQDAPESSSAAGMTWMGLAGVALFVVALLGFQFLNHRRRLQEMKLKTLETLARQGKIGREDIDRALGQTEGFPTPVVILSWISLLVSVMFVILSQSDYRWRDGFLPALLVAVVSFAVLSTPFLLRELRRES